MKANLEFNLPEDDMEFKQASKAGAAFAALDDIKNEIFRPARKHGYSDENIRALLEKIGEDGNELIGLLESKLYEILNNHEVNID